MGPRWSSSRTLPRRNPWRCAELTAGSVGGPGEPTSDTYQHAEVEVVNVSAPVFEVRALTLPASYGLLVTDLLGSNLTTVSNASTAAGHTQSWATLSAPASGLAAAEANWHLLRPNASFFVAPLGLGLGVMSLDSSCNFRCSNVDVPNELTTLASVIGPFSRQVGGLSSLGYTVGGTENLSSVMVTVLDSPFHLQVVAAGFSSELQMPTAALQVDLPSVILAWEG